MPEATEDIKEGQELDARVSALVSNTVPPPVAAAPAAENAEIDIDALAAEVLAELESPAVASSVPNGIHPSTAPEVALEEAAAEMSAPPTAPAPATTQNVAAPGVDLPDADLASAIEKLLHEDPQPVSATEPAPEKIETLDAKIADAADDLIAGEFADELNNLQGQVGEEPVSPVAAPVAATPAPAPPRAAPTEPVARPQPAPVLPVVPPVPTPSPAKTPKKTKADAAKLAAKATGVLKPAAVKLAGLLSAPLATRPKRVRDSVGWIALVTLFNASCLWMYVLFFRSATPPKQNTPAAATSHEPEKKDAGHGEKKAEKPKADKAKKPAKKDAAKASHGGGH